jgi:hypothetical protein
VSGISPCGNTGSVRPNVKIRTAQAPEAFATNRFAKTKSKVMVATRVELL